MTDTPSQPSTLKNPLVSRCTVAAWIGSENLGDELVFAGLVPQLRGRGLEPVALSTSPVATRSEHGTEAVRRVELLRWGGGADATVFGGGGLLQDETSTLNLDLHLSPVLAARARREPIVGVGLGAGRLDTRSGRWRVRSALAGVPLAVRDEGSADLLETIGLSRPTVAADLALSLPRPDVDARDRVVVALRPWSGRRHRIPARFRRHRSDDAFVAGAAQALDDLADATGMAIHLVAFDAPKDDPLHRSVADRMRHTPTLTCPSVHDVIDEVATGRLVVAMRYHAGISAVLAGRPTVLVGYSDKVRSLADELGRGGAGLPFDADGLPGLAAAAASVLDHGDDVDAAYGTLVERERGNGRVLDQLAEQVASRRR